MNEFERTMIRTIKKIFFLTAIPLTVIIVGSYILGEADTEILISATLLFIGVATWDINRETNKSQEQQVEINKLLVEIQIELFRFNFAREQLSHPPTPDEEAIQNDNSEQAKRFKQGTKQLRETLINSPVKIFAKSKKLRNLTKK